MANFGFRMVEGKGFGAVAAVAACLAGCANPMSGKRFACDEPGTQSTCLSGYLCVATPGHSYKGVCTPAGEVGDLGPWDPGSRDLVPLNPDAGEDAGPDPGPDSQVVCKPNDHKQCSGGNVYWFDSCGVKGALAETCACGCTGDACNCCPNCNGKICGDDGCGGSCGTCVTGNTCQAGQCQGNGCPAGYVLVPPGQFTMGATPDEPGQNCWAHNQPQHQVTIGKAFCLKATEVTQAEWQAAMGNNPSYFSSCGGTCPVEQVSWWDAVAYCNKLSEKEGLQKCYGLTGCSGTPGKGDYSCTGVTFVGLGCTGYRLPTESEWEYAARAGTTTATYNGTEAHAEESNCQYCSASSVLDPIAWWCGNAGSKTHPVKTTTIAANPWGLSDMLGNVWEWVEDCWHDGYNGHPTDGTAWQDGCSAGSVRVVRGGCWFNFAYVVRAAIRSYDDPGYRSIYLGFRPARSVP